MEQPEYIDQATAQYAETELWSQLDWESADSEDDNAECFDAWAGVDDITPETMAAMRVDVADFVSANWALVKDLEPSQVGHDFALTRNGHGTGFWDRGLGEIGDKLTDACRPYGETNYFRVTDPETGADMVSAE